MAVIITDMDMPASCVDCPILYDCMLCPITSTKVNFDRMTCEKLKNCPLKSADEMKNEMLDYSFSVVNPSNTYEYVNVVNLEDIEAVIDKYCDKE